ncbi:MAG: flippase [Defluviitaleaceae bacterium]|nr:flippase [Defluviitaleaceae bacterium]
MTENLEQKPSIKKNAMYNMIMTVVGLLVPIITFPYFARILLPEGLGINSFLTGFVGYFIIFASLGIPIYAVRQCAMYQNDKHNLSQNFQEIYILNVVFAIISFFTLVTISFFIEEIYRHYFLIIFIAIEGFLRAINAVWLLQAKEKYKFLSIRTMILTCLQIVFLFSFVRSPEHLYRYVLIISSLGVISSIVSILYARKFVSFKRLQKYNFKRHLKPIFLFLLLVLGGSVIANLGTVMLGFMLGEEYVGLYSVGIKIARMILVGVASIITVLVPRITFYVENNKVDDFRKLLARAVNVICIIAIPIVLFLAIYAYDIILLLLGYEFTGSAIVLRIDAAIIFIATLTNIIGLQYLIPLKKERFVIVVVSIAAVMCLILNIILIPILGIIGAAIATLIAEILVLTVELIYVKKDVWWLFSKIKIARIAILLAMAIGLILLSLFVNLSSLFNLLIGGAFFMICMTLLVLNSGDESIKAMLDKVLKRKKVVAEKIEGVNDAEDKD